MLNHLTEFHSLFHRICILIYSQRNFHDSILSIYIWSKLKSIRVFCRNNQFVIEFIRIQYSENMAEISGLSNSEVAELCKPVDPATKVCTSETHFCRLKCVDHVSLSQWKKHKYWTMSFDFNCRTSFFNKQCTALKIHAHPFHSIPVFWAWLYYKNWTFLKRNFHCISWDMKIRLMFQRTTMLNVQNGQCRERQLLN